MIPPKPTQTATPFPTVGTALLLTFGSIVAGGLVGLLFIDLGPLAAEGLGTALGIGGVATLAARRVGDPQAQRLGFVPLEWRAWPLILGLVPTIFLASELDNFAYDGSAGPVRNETAETAETSTPAATAPSMPAATSTSTRAVASQASSTGAATTEPGQTDPPDTGSAAPTTDETAPREASDTNEATGSTDATDAESATAAGDAKPAGVSSRDGKKRDAEEVEPEELIDRDDPFNVMEGLIVAVGIAPVIHEFLFRGVLQQGLVAQLGIARGVGLTALLWTMLRPVPSSDPGRFVAAFVAWLAMGWLLGMVRIATGSILGPILLASLWAAIGFGSFALEHVHPIPGMNVEGTHLPIPVTVASLAAVTWAALRLRERVSQREDERVGGRGPGPGDGSERSSGRPGERSER